MSGPISLHTLTLSTVHPQPSKYSASARSPRRCAGSLLTITVRAEMEWIRCNAKDWRARTKRWKFRWRKVRTRKVKMYAKMRLTVA
jgi:hypothetical protein